MKQNERQLRCCFCGEPLLGLGNNPEPLASAELGCCDSCNMTRVIPARLKEANSRQAEVKA